MTATKTYRMQMRVVRSAPHFDTITVDRVDIEATSAHAAEDEARRRMMRAYPEAREAYAATKRRIKS